LQFLSHNFESFLAIEDIAYKLVIARYVTILKNKVTVAILRELQNIHNWKF